MIYKINNLRLSIIHKTNNSNQYTIPSIKINLLFNVMKIIIKNNKRLLVKDDSSEVNIDDGDVVEYNGVYYNHIKNEIYDVFEKETIFVGIVV